MAAISLAHKLCGYLPGSTRCFAIALLASTCVSESPNSPDVPDPPQWQIREDLRIDGYKADLVQITGVAVAKDGTIALNQTQDHGVRFFGPDGSDLGLVGREGTGPGEFSLLVSSGWLADTLWAFDMQQLRYTLIAKDTRFLRNQIPPGQVSLIAADGNSITYRVNWWYGLYADSQMLGTIVLPSAQRSSLEEGEVILARIGFDGTVRKVLLRYERGKAGVTVRSSGGYSAASIPYSNKPIFSAASDAQVLVLATADVDGPALGSFRVLVVDPNADTLFDRRYGFRVMELPEDLVKGAIESQARALEDRTPELAQALRRESELPSVYPPLLGVLPGRDGSIWIRLRSATDMNQWLVLDGSGDPIGSLFVDGGTRIAVADQSAVWALESDDVGVQSLVRYQIVKD